MKNVNILSQWGVLSLYHSAGQNNIVFTMHLNNNDYGRLNSE